MKSIKRNFVLNMIFHVLRLITPLVVTPYISRILGADGVGIFSYTYSVQYYFTILAVLGTYSYGAREVARNQNDPVKRSTLFWEIELMTVATSLVSMIGWGVLICLTEKYRIYYLILTLYLLAAMADISWFFAGMEDFPQIVVRNIVIRLLEVTAILLLVNKREDLWIYFLIMAGGTFLGNISVWLGLPRHLVRVNWKKLQIIRHFRGTFVYFLPTIATTIYTVLDKTLIGLITKDTRENGYYEQATKVVEIAKAISFTALNTVLGPRSTFLYANEEYEKVKTNLKLSLEVNFFLGCGFTFGIIGLSDLFVPWFFGPGFDEVSVLLKYLVPIILVIIVSNALGYQYYDPSGRRLQSAKYLAIGAGCNLILNCILIPRFKSVGAVIASVLAELVITALYLNNCDHYLSFKDIIRASWKKLIAGALMMCVLLIRQKAYNPDLKGIVLLILQGVICYILLLILLRDKVMVLGFQEIKARRLRKEGERN